MLPALDDVDASCAFLCGISVALTGCADVAVCACARIAEEDLESAGGVVFAEVFVAFGENGALLCVSVLLALFTYVRMGRLRGFYVLLFCLVGTQRLHLFSLPLVWALSALELAKGYSSQLLLPFWPGRPFEQRLLPGFRLSIQPAALRRSRFLDLLALS